MIGLLALALTAAAGGAFAQSGPLTMTGSKGDVVFAVGQMIDAKAELYGDLADVTITFAPDAAVALNEFTALHVGEEINILSCGKVLFSPRIIEPISGGAVVVAGLEIPQALALHDVIVGKADCPDSH